MIREATERDVPRLVEMGVHFLRSEYAEKLTENREQMCETVSAIISRKQNGCVLVAENGHVCGMLAFVVFPHFFSGELVAGELVWWVEPEARGSFGLRLLREAEKAASAMGAKQMQMISPSERTSKLYARLGYSPVEATFQRRLV